MKLPVKYQSLRYQGLGRIWGLAMVSLVASLVGSCTQQGNLAQEPDSKPKVVGSHSVICDIVNTIAQETIDLTCLLKNNQDPHSFSPTPSARQAMAEADLILYGGYELEPQLIKLLEASTDQEGSQVQVAVYERAVIEPIMTEHEHEHSDDEHHAEEAAAHQHSEDEHHPEEATAHQHSDDEHHAEEAELAADPHIWHDVTNAVAIVEELKPRLIELNPQLEAVYLDNSTALTEQLWQLDAWIKDTIETIPPGQRVLITTHSSFNYYVQAYNLEDYQTLQGLSTVASPSASQVRELVAEIQQAKVPTIFAESRTSDRVLRNVARAAQVELSPTRLYADGLGDATSYIEMMSYNTCVIANNLGGECEAFTLK